MLQKCISERLAGLQREEVGAHLLCWPSHRHARVEPAGAHGTNMTELMLPPFPKIFRILMAEQRLCDILFSVAMHAREWL